ncbi:MAG: hypothetical protein ACO1N8_01400 [Methylophilus sp.]
MLKTFFKKLTSLSETQLQWLFTSVAVLVAWRVMYIQHGWINDDSVLYFEVAKLFSAGEWKQGLALYNWPLYPAILTIIHNLTNANIQLSAQFLNIFFFSLTTFSFITLVRLAGGDKLTIVCSVALLFSAPYITGDILAMLLRDEGFWAFFLLSVTYFIRFYRSGNIQEALLWQVFSIISVLFRVEGVTFLFFLPLVLLINNKNAPCSHAWLKSNAITISLLLLTSITLVFSPLKLLELGRLNELVTVLQRAYTNVTLELIKKSYIMGEQVLGSYLDEYGMMGVGLTLVTILLLKCIFAPGWIATFILISNWKNGLSQLTSDTRKIFYWLSIIAILNAAIILTSVFVLSGRYLISLGFIMLIFCGFSLKNLISTPNKSRFKLFLITFVFVLIGLSLIRNFLPKGEGYNYEQTAVNWIQTRNSTHRPVFYVSPRARYYAGAPYDGRGYDYWDYVEKSIRNGSIQEYDYLAINMTSHHPEREKALIDALPNHQLAKEFLGYKAKKKIMIFVKKEKT